MPQKRSVMHLPAELMGVALALGLNCIAVAAADQQQPADLLSATFINQKWTGDLDGMIKRRVIRVLVVYSKTHYFIDRGTQRGISYEFGNALEEQLNKKYKTSKLRVHVAFIPVSRDDLLPALIEGRGDIAVAGLTKTPERQKLVDFAQAGRSDVNEIIVTGPESLPVANVDDLGGREIYVRPSSSYHASLVALNAQIKKDGKPAIKIEPAPENLEDEDLLEMLNAGLLKYVIVDDYLAEFWAKVLPDIRLHPELAVRVGGELAPAFRKGSSQLAAELNAFLKTHAKGTTFGNVVLQKYLQSTKYVKNATAEAEMKKFRALIDLFRKYGDQYGLDWVLIAAQGYQESQLDHSVHSPVGAIGVMQVMPATGAEMKVGDVAQIEPNVHAGVKYIRYMIDRYFKDEPMDELNKTLFAFAAYNAGPARLRQLRAEAVNLGLNPNVWFGNVERVAAEKVGSETVNYVSNIYKYYVAYRLTLAEKEEKAMAKEGLQ